MRRSDWNLVAGANPGKWLATDHRSVMVAAQRFMAGSDRNLVQRVAEEAVATEPLQQSGRVGASDIGVCKVRKPITEAN